MLEKKYNWNKKKREEYSDDYKKEK